MSDDPLGLDPMTYSVMSKCHHANNAAAGRCEAEG